MRRRFVRIRTRPAPRGSRCFPLGRLGGDGEAPQPAATVARMTDQDQTDQTHHQIELGELIDRVCGQLKIDTEYVEQQARILSATEETSTHEEFAALGASCADLQHRAQAAAHELTAAGIQEWVYSVKACHEVAFRANEAMQQAQAAAQSASDTEIRGYLRAAEDALSYAAQSIRGAVG